MSPDEFDCVVAAACARIPARFRKRMKNLAVIVEPEPSAAQLARVDRGAPSRRHTLLGLYEGRPLPTRSVFEPFAMPDRITIFQGPHERLAASPEQLVRLVEDTVWHEVAHYFGLDEREVRAAERRRHNQP
jgi:predicted Zn-dependent protease with MMP-like domain